jgi:hypothetical protein
MRHAKVITEILYYSSDSFHATGSNMKTLHYQFTFLRGMHLLLSTKQYTNAPFSTMLQELPEVGLLGPHSSNYQITRDIQLILKFQTS